MANYEDNFKKDATDAPCVKRPHFSPSMTLLVLLSLVFSVLAAPHAAAGVKGDAFNSFFNNAVLVHK